MAYQKTVYVNDSTPPISAENLNKQENELEYLDGSNGRSNEFFGVYFILEQGGLNTSTGAEVANNERTRSNFLSLKAGDVINQSGLYVYLLKYNSISSYNGLVTSGRNNITIASDGLYRLLFSTGDVAGNTDALTITRQSSKKTLQELSDETSQNPVNNYTFHNYTSESNLNIPDARVFTRDFVPKGQFIDSITFHQKSIASAITNKIEIWGNTNGTLSLLDTITYTNTLAEEKDVTIKYGRSFDKDVHIAVVYGSSATIFAMVSASGNDRDIRTTDKSSSSISLSSLGNIGYRANVKANVYKATSYIDNVVANLIGEAYNIVRIGKKERFTEIQDALDYYTDDSSSKHYIYIINPGTYKKFDMTKLGRVRYISMIGVCKDTCIIRDDTGQYLNAPALVYSNGLFKDLTFIATHDSPPDYADREDAAHKSYALHMDCGTQDVRFEDCIFISYQAPAVGIGCYQDVKYYLKNCEMYSYTPTYDASDTDNRTNFSLLCNYGGLFAHSNTGNNKTNQRLILDNCRVYSQNGDKGMWIAIAGSFTNCEMLVSLMNTMAISYAEGSEKAVISNSITIQPESFGNNFEI